jgi:hypothetical protein
VNTSRNNCKFQSFFNENFSKGNAQFLLENLAVGGILLERDEKEMKKRDDQAYHTFFYYTWLTAQP